MHASMGIILLAFVRMQSLVVKLSICNHFQKLLVSWKLVEILGSAFLEASLWEFFWILDVEQLFSFS